MNRDCLYVRERVLCLCANTWGQKSEKKWVRWMKWRAEGESVNSKVCTLNDKSRSRKAIARPAGARAIDQKLITYSVAFSGAVEGLCELAIRRYSKVDSSTDSALCLSALPSLMSGSWCAHRLPHRPNASIVQTSGAIKNNNKQLPICHYRIVFWALRQKTFRSRFDFLKNPPPLFVLLFSRSRTPHKQNY